jgi:ABC-type uncharacterized transport system substrate-binding protein
MIQYLKGTGCTTSIDLDQQLSRLSRFTHNAKSVCITYKSLNSKQQQQQQQQK